MLPIIEKGSHYFVNAPRKGEQQALLWADINMKLWKVDIYKTLSVKVRDGGYKITNTKNRKNRQIDILEESRALLEELYNFYSQLDGFNDNWFVFGGIRFLPQTTIDRKIHYYIQKTNEKRKKKLRYLSHHELSRHSHASYLRSIGLSYERIAERLGDTTRVIEETYAHLYKDNKKSLFIMEVEQARKNINKFYKIENSGM